MCNYPPRQGFTPTLVKNQEQWVCGFETLLKWVVTHAFECATPLSSLKNRKASVTTFGLLYQFPRLLAPGYQYSSASRHVISRQLVYGLVKQFFELTALDDTRIN